MFQFTSYSRAAEYGQCAICDTIVKLSTVLLMTINFLMYCNTITGLTFDDLYSHMH